MSIEVTPLSKNLNLKIEPIDVGFIDDEYNSKLVVELEITGQISDLRCVSSIDVYSNSILAHGWHLASWNFDISRTPRIIIPWRNDIHELAFCFVDLAGNISKPQVFKTEKQIKLLQKKEHE